VTTITEVFDDVLAKDPNRMALVCESRSLTYRELDAEADAAAAAFGELGVRPGDRLAACLPNDADIVVAFHGAMRLGAIWVGLNRTLAPAEREVLLAASAPSVLLAGPETAADHVRTAAVVRVDPADPAGPWNLALEASRGAKRLPPPPARAPAAIAYTSGTTGLPKGIVHSQANLLLPAMSMVSTRHYDATLRKGDCLALTILNMQILTTLLTSAAGGCCLLTDHRHARGIAEWIERERVNVWNGVPAILYSMVRDPEIRPEMLAGLREVWTGGGPCPEELFAAFRSRFGVPLYQGYGLTEVPSVVSFEPIDVEHVEGSTGVVLPHLEVVVHDELGRDLPCGREGEIVVRGVRSGPLAGSYTPMLGYWKEGVIEPPAEADLATGDVGCFDAAGNLFLRGRKTLLIIRGGANIYPADVERILEGAPGVVASAVIGLPDARLGQRVVAVVEVATGLAVAPEDLRRHCGEHLARDKVPEEIVIVDRLPRNAMGKVQRGQLADLFEPVAESPIESPGS
jgi:O-succinylbenzoic acid--CoA ligase